MQDTSKMTPQELYAYRIQLYRDAIAFKKPDRIPINTNMFTWMFLDAGYSPTKAARSYDLINDSIQRLKERRKMIRLAIVEDEYRQCGRIVSLLKKYDSEQQQDSSITVYTNSVDLVEG